MAGTQPHSTRSPYALPQPVVDTSQPVQITDLTTMPSPVTLATVPIPTSTTATAPLPAVPQLPGGAIASTILGAVPDLSVPSSLGRVLNVGRSAPAPRVFKQLPNYTTALSNKYGDPEVAAAFATLDQRYRNGLIQLDAQRVAAGSPPLTKDETLRAIQTITTNTPATPPPERSILNVPGNILSDAANIIHSIPSLPVAMLHELTSLGQTDHSTGNPLVNMLRSPGIRMVPGTYTLSNLLSGGHGVKEAATHPLMTFLDLLPGASKLAEATPVVRAAQEAADLSTGARVRPLGVLATRTLDEAGNVVPNAFGDLLRRVRTDTPTGQAFSQAFGKDARAVSRQAAIEALHVKGQMAGLIGDSEAAQLAADSFRLDTDFVTRNGWDQAQLARLHDIATIGDPAVYPTLGAEELAYIHQARNLADRYGNLLTNDQAGLAKIIDPRDGRAEFYPSEKAAEIERARALARHSERMANLRRIYLSEQADHFVPLTADSVSSMMDDALAAGDNRWTRNEMRAVRQVLEAHGYETSSLKKFESIGSRTRNWTEFRAAVIETVGHPTDPLIGRGMPPQTRMTTAEIVSELRRHKQDVMAAQLAYAISKRDTKLITYALNAIEDRQKFRLPLSDNPDFASTVRSLRDRYTFDAQVGKRFTDPLVGRMFERADKMLTKAPPARFDLRLARDTADLIPARVGEQIVGRQLSAEEAARVITAVQDAHWNALSDMGVGADELRYIYDDTYREVASTWRALKADGVDPVFVHNVSLPRARAMLDPKVGPVPNALSQVKARASDFTPGVRDLGVALTHQGVEMLTRAGSERFIEWMVDNYGVTQADLMNMYIGQAHDLALAQPEFTARGHLQRLVDRGWVKFNPDEAGYSWGGSRLDKYRGDNLYYIPKSIAKNLKAMNDPAAPLIGRMNKLTRTFRLSVVALSPRTQLYNILGGATMLLGETGPGVFKYIEQARAMVRDPIRIVNETLRSEMGSMKAAQLDDAALAVPRAQLLAGRTLGRILNDIQGARAAGKVRDAFGRVASRSLDLNGFFDDTYRVMGYLYAKDKALARGLSADVAEQAGLEMTRKVMMDWTGLTPFERNTLKAIFPFYGFMNHAMRYVLRFPVDHPLRAEIIGAFGRTEAEDAKVLPASFLASIFFGPVSSTGHRNALNAAPINPFNDVASMFTFAGLLSATNPLLSTMFESVGLIRGEAELYPTLRYDPESGRLSAQHPNPLLALVENTIPQTAVILSMLGLNGEFRDRMQRDPAAASRFLWSSAGMPILWRSWSLPGEIAKAEIARGTSEDSARTSALKSGDWTQALRYPGLRDDYQRLLQATPLELAQYQPQGADIYTAMIEQALGRQQVQAQQNAQVGSGV